jgi:aconitate hydratase
MGAELGATTSVFPFDERMYAYLMATGRKAIAGFARRNKELLAADPKIEKEPDKFFDQVIEIDLSKLEPYVVGPHSPDLARPISKLASDIEKNKWPCAISTALIGSCTNSSYEDIGRAASVARQASKKALKSKCRLLVTPGSERIYSTIKRDGQLKALEQIGASVLANACGPCIGQWKRDDVNPDEPNSILTSFNRNFPKRNDGSENTFAFIASPEIVIAMSLYGDLRFNPLSDFIKIPDGRCLLLESPKSEELPKRGFARKASGCEPVLSSQKRRSIQVKIKPQSERLKELSPFLAWDGKDFDGLFVLVKARGQCTTDHISPAGKWLQYRGHLDRISDNIFLGAKNEFSDKSGFGLDMLDGVQKSIPEIARRYKKEGIGWVVLGEHNYGEGSSREHAAMSPRYLGCEAVIVKSFARLHETNLKKQGVLPLIFEDASDYDTVKADSKIDIVGLKDLSPGKCVKMLVKQADGSVKAISLRHTLNEEQIKWFKAGSALNLIRNS